MRAYADTSFLFALMVRDANSGAALEFLGSKRPTLPFTALQRVELRNAIRLAVFRGHIAAPTANAAVGRIARDQENGNLLDSTLSWPELIGEADRIGERLTAAIGIRTIGLLHIGAAFSLGLKDFLTFDRRQKACAKASGLRVGP